MKKVRRKRVMLISLAFFMVLANLSLTNIHVKAGVKEAPEFREGSVHDPSVIKVDDTFYVFGSHLAAAKSTDLMQWERVADGVNSSNPLFDDVTKELSEALEWANSDTLWAADVTQVGDQFFMYYNACEGTSPRSAMGLAIADDIEGPYVDQGIFLKSGMWDQESENKGEVYNPTVHPNAIDPHAFYDAEGNFWLLYGSYSGGIFILELDAITGFPIEEGYGTHLIGANHARMEGPYMQYSEETGYYYLHLTYGGLGAGHGYNMRVMRSENPDGPFYDAAGNLMEDVGGPAGSMFDDDAIAPYGVKTMGDFLFRRYSDEPGNGFGTGYVSPGHNSVYTNEEGEQFLFFHTRFPYRGEAHEIRVHQMVMNSNGWPVVAPYRYAGEKVEPIAEEDVYGTYKFINHGLEFSGEINEAEIIELHEDGTLSGSANGKWNHYDEFRITLSIDGADYDGMLLNQWNPTTREFGITFAGIADNNMTVWGSKTIDGAGSAVDDSDDEDLEKDSDQIGTTTEIEETEVETTYLLWVIISAIIVVVAIVLIVVKRKGNK
ncbi:arabinan endo-1,5-alpha-L-arabinosidase [Natronobacillus azotifigens]|uniref:Glycoside hydrolase family 43 protein n=1 Tax=Natronobacillus azotifigens TaxID=472978 RepID=A0A9J6RE80_9BACI|nr:glycoside hydrolase family 43 protein [Natronobacillus azotifigens]MCZ0703773.1 glycoside hydrolase family 43 protein [Natronobacillus azotifigens]